MTTHADEACDSPLEVRACGRQWLLHRSASLDALWDAMTADESSPAFEDERIPYWTELWPSSVVLAEWLALRRASLVGVPCLDMGCGLGLTATVGAWLGARVLAMDYEPEAVRFARRNALANGVAPPLFTVMDWRCPAVRRGSMARIWGGDIMYEKRFVRPVLCFLEHALAHGGKAWIAEPGRTVYDAFRHALHGMGWQGRRVHSATVEPLYAQPVRVTVHVWELERAPGRAAP